MAFFDEHVAQAKSNLQFLETVNQAIRNYYDWQVTICFYTAVHLAEAIEALPGFAYEVAHI